MHELAVCQGLIGQLERIAREQRAGRITAVRLRIGPLSGVESALIESAWPLASAGTVAADARLAIARAPLTVRCVACAAESEVEVASLLCRACGSWRIELLSGEEMLLESVELERTDA